MHHTHVFVYPPGFLSITIDLLISIDSSEVFGVNDL